MGPLGFSPGVVGDVSLAFDPTTGAPAVAFRDASITNKPASVYKFDGAAWNPVGAPFGSGEAQRNSLAFDAAGTPYCAFVDASNGFRAAVYKFDGAAWAPVGGAPYVSPAQTSFTSLAIDGAGVPHVAINVYAEGDKGYVYKPDGAGGWAAVGGSFGEVKNAAFLAVHAATGALFVGYRDQANGQVAAVAKYSGNAWASLGSPPGAALSLGFALDAAGAPYLAVQDPTFTASVFKHNGAAWVQLGAATAGQAWAVNLALSASGTPFLGYQDKDNGFRATVARWDGSAFVTVRNAGFTPGQYNGGSLAVDPASGHPYFAFNDLANGLKAAVMSST